MSNTAKLTVLFEDPFWVGIYEREDEGKYEVCKLTFGAEPRDYEVWELLLKNFKRLKFSPSLRAEKSEPEKLSPKRLQRQISKQLQVSPIGTKAQQALKLQQEQGKLERKTRSREQRLEEEKRLFELRQAKKKEKHAGH